MSGWLKGVRDVEGPDGATWIQVDGYLHHHITDVEAYLLAELEFARQGLWDCFKFAGGDTDGDEEWHCDARMAAVAATETVKSLRAAYDESLDGVR